MHHVLHNVLSPVVKAAGDTAVLVILRTCLVASRCLLRAKHPPCCMTDSTHSKNNSQSIRGFPTHFYKTAVIQPQPPHDTMSTSYALVIRGICASFVQHGDVNYVPSGGNWGNCAWVYGFGYAKQLLNFRWPLRELALASSCACGLFFATGVELQGRQQQ